MTHTLLLPAELTIYTVGELRPQWLTWLGRLGADDSSVEAPVDGSAVDQIDAAGVQLLVALSRSLAAAQRSLQFLNPSPVLVSACVALGLPSPQPASDADGGAA